MIEECMSFCHNTLSHACSEHMLASESLLEYAELFVTVTSKVDYCLQTLYL